MTQRSTKAIASPRNAPDAWKDTKGTTRNAKDAQVTPGIPAFVDTSHILWVAGIGPILQHPMML